MEGRIRTCKWQRQDGHDKYTPEISADAMQILGRREGGGSPEYEARGNSAPSARPAPAKTGSAPSSPPPLNDFEDDIPF